jgi:predicted nucleic acid-binding protein
MVSVVDHLRAQPAVTVVPPGPRHGATLRPLLIGTQARRPLARYAHLAALALEHSATLDTTDRDLTRVAGLRVAKPAPAPAGLPS